MQIEAARCYTIVELINLGSAWLFFGWLWCFIFYCYSADYGFNLKPATRLLGNYQQKFWEKLVVFQLCM